MFNNKVLFISFFYVLISIFPVSGITAVTPCIFNGGEADQPGRQSVWNIDPPDDNPAPLSQVFPSDCPNGIEYTADYDDLARSVIISSQRYSPSGQRCIKGDKSPLASSTVDDSKPGYLNLPGFNTAFSKRNSQTYNYAWFGNQYGTACGVIGKDYLLVNATGKPGAPKVLMDVPLQGQAGGYWILPTQPLTAGTSPYGTFYTPVGDSQLALTCGPYSVSLELPTTDPATPGSCPRDGTIVAPANPIPTAPMWIYAAIVLLLGMTAMKKLQKGGFGNGLKLEALVFSS